jgi:hypothetical protein
MTGDGGIKGRWSDGLLGEIYRRCSSSSNFAAV